MPATQEHARPRSLLRRLRLFEAVRFIVITALFGWFYGWVSPHCFPEHQRAGFSWGMLHGALMPMALPSLVMGKDVDIYDATNTGRFYKLGYIAGINLCGLVFLGSIFWSPRKKTSHETGSGPPTGTIQ
jgi:hypothetical protein